MRSAWTCSVPKHRIGPRGRSRDACTLRRLSPRRQPDRVTAISLPSCRLLRSLPEGRLGFRLREALGLHRALAFTSTAAWVISLRSAMAAIPLLPSWVAPLRRSWMVPGVCPVPQRAADPAPPRWSATSPRQSLCPWQSASQRPAPSHRPSGNRERSTSGPCSADESDGLLAVSSSRHPSFLPWALFPSEACPHLPLAFPSRGRSIPPPACVGAEPEGSTRRPVASVRRCSVRSRCRGRRPPWGFSTSKSD